MSTSTSTPGPSSSNLRKACDACHASKVKCVLSENSTPEAPMCQRCIRLNVACIFSPPDTAPRKRRRGSQTQRELSSNGQPADTETNSGSSVSASSPPVPGPSHDTGGLDFLSTFQDGLGFEDTAMTQIDNTFLSTAGMDPLDSSFFVMPQMNSDPANSASLAQMLSSPHSSPQELKAIAQEQFIKLINLSCTLQTVQNGDTPPRIISVEQGIETLSSFWSTVNEFSLMPPPPVSETPDALFTHKCGASAYVAPNVVMLSFSIAFQLISCISHLSNDAVMLKGNNMSRSIPELSLFAASLSTEDQLRIKAVIVNAQLRKLAEIMDNVVHITHHMHANPAVPCLVRTTAQAFKDKCSHLRDHQLLSE